MKLKITTEVWAGEYDPAEFTEGHTVVSHTYNNMLEVTEYIEFDPKRTTIAFEA